MSVKSDEVFTEIIEKELSNTSVLNFGVNDNEKLLLNIKEEAKKLEVPIVFAIVPSIVQVEDELWEFMIIDKVENQNEYSRN